MEHSNNYTLVRLLLATAVLYSHSFALLGLDEPVALNRTFGNAAVHGFFVISGYLITGSYLTSSGLGIFALKRVLRIGPALVVGYAASMWALAHFDRFADNPVPYIANGSIWTLSWEVLMYLGVAFAGLMGMLRRSVLASVYACCLIIFFLNSASATLPFLSIAPLAMLFLGGSFIRLHAGIFDVRRYGLASVLLLAAIFTPETSSILFSGLKTIPFLWGPELSIANLQLLIYIVALPFAMIFICQYFYVSVPIKNDYSYGVYLFAWPLQQAVVSTAQQRDFLLGPLGLFLMAGGLTVLASVVSWHLLERPMMQLRTLRLPGHRTVLKVEDGARRA